MSDKKFSHEELTEFYRKAGYKMVDALCKRNAIPILIAGISEGNDCHVLGNVMAFQALHKMNALEEFLEGVQDTVMNLMDQPMDDWNIVGDYKATDDLGSLE
jgi:hypothetical protein